jgi:hypothetical protein
MKRTLLNFGKSSFHSALQFAILKEAMFRRGAALLCLTALVLCGTTIPAQGHGIVGKRLFIEPLFTEDANPKTELDFPVFESIHLPDGHYSAFNYGLEKKLSARFSVSFENSYNWFSPNGEPGVSGFNNVGFGAKYALYTSPKHEFIVSSWLGVDAPTGDVAAGAEPFTTITPGFLYAKGFGDLPSSGFSNWLRPFAVQGDFLLDFPAGAPNTPERANVPQADLVIEYSLPYLNAYVRHANAGYSVSDGGFRNGFSLGAIAGDLFPFVELNFEAAPYRGGRRAFGYYRPGVDYVGHYFQVGFAAELPANAFTGSHIGAVGIFDIFLDEVFPKFSRLHW